MTLIIRLPAGRRIEKPDHWVAYVCLHLCGGGTSPGQAERAMVLQAQLKKKGTASHRGVSLTLIPDPPPKVKK